MTSSFHIFRLATQAVLIASLLVFGHVLLTTLATTPVPAKALSDELPGAIKSLSALTFLSLLWLSFTLLEAADVPTPGQDKKDNDDDEEMWVFLRTDVQIFLGATACLGWMLFWRSAILVLDTFSPSIAAELVLLRISFLLSMSALAVNQMQIVVSLVLYALTHDPKDMLHRSFWKGKMGWWCERIRLDEEACAEKI